MDKIWLNESKYDQLRQNKTIWDKLYQFLLKMLSWNIFFGPILSKIKKRYKVSQGNHKVFINKVNYTVLQDKNVNKQTRSRWTHNLKKERLASYENNNVSIAWLSTAQTTTTQ